MCEHSDLHGLSYTLPVTEDLVQIFCSENISQSCLREESAKLIQLKLIVSPDCPQIELIGSVGHIPNWHQECLCQTDKLNWTKLMLHGISYRCIKSKPELSVLNTGIYSYDAQVTMRWCPNNLLNIHVCRYE